MVQRRRLCAESNASERRRPPCVRQCSGHRESPPRGGGRWRGGRETSRDWRETRPLAHLPVPLPTHIHTPPRPAPCGLRGCKNGPAPFPGRMSYKATKPGLVFVLYLSMFFFIVLVFIRAPFYVLLVFIVCVLSFGCSS